MLHVLKLDGRALVFAGCASPRIQASKVLAESGATTAGQLHAAAISVHQDAAVLPKLEAIEIAVVTGSPPSSNIDAEVLRRIREGLKARAETAESLSKVYISFKNLTDYDARAEIDTTRDLDNLRR